MPDLNQTEPYPSTQVDELAAAIPQYIGRYRVERVVGKGGFGLVYLAHDDQLQRLVAIKVPHRNLIARRRRRNLSDRSPNRRRTRSSQHRSRLRRWQQRGNAVLSRLQIHRRHDSRPANQGPPAFSDGDGGAGGAGAETLHYAHRNALVHRDIKPSNILLDKSGKPFVADFGLVLRERDVGTGPRHVGTPTYMSRSRRAAKGIASMAAATFTVWALSSMSC